MGDTRLSDLADCRNVWRAHQFLKRRMCRGSYDLNASDSWTGRGSGGKGRLRSTRLCHSARRCMSRS
ncbi:MAG: hypothetical protein KGI75_30260, partial [Rhizobiaceae bacterium]|nr:hypothetical protein [Rhizobiaceae bacterium]